MLQDILHFFDNYYSYFFLFATALTAGSLAGSWYRINKYGIKFPDKNSVTVKFEENMVSGKSAQLTMKKSRAVKNCLIVTVTDDELWITANFPFSLLAYNYDAIHKISLSSINNVSKSDNKTIIEFQGSAGDIREFELQLREPEKFIQILNELG